MSNHKRDHADPDRLGPAAAGGLAPAEIDWSDYARRFQQQPKIGIATLAPVQRMLLTSDGTLTDLLESYLLEPIDVDKLTERPLRLTGASPLELSGDEQVVSERRIVLRGRQSQSSWLYAESLIVTRRLESRFGLDLATTNKPIGRLWVDHRVETFKQILGLYTEPAGAVAALFDGASDQPLLCRTYLVYSGGAPVMLISEKFPRSLYA